MVDAHPARRLAWLIFPLLGAAAALAFQFVGPLLRPPLDYRLWSAGPPLFWIATGIALARSRRPPPQQVLGHLLYWGFFLGGCYVAMLIGSAASRG
jgi:hypothetical protein